MSSSSKEDAAIRYSGLETKGMKKVNCSLLLPDSFECGKTWIEPQKVTVRVDYGAPDFSVDFPGAGVCMLMCSGGEMAVVAGKCHYTKQCHKDFSIMMRTKKQGKEQGLGKNSEFKWPDVQAFQLCPFCEKRNDPSKGKQYWMILHMLIQAASVSKSTGTLIIGARLQCQLVCTPCLEKAMAKKCFMDSSQNVMETLEAMPGMPLFVGVDRQGYNKDGEKILTAWQLYNRWENTGTFQALSNHFTSTAGQVMGSPEKLADPNAKTCLVCKITLKKNANVCSRCKKATYCSRECQRKDWKRHKIIDCVKQEIKPQVHKTASFTARPVCGLCRLPDIDKGLIVMCFCCGTIQMCHLCAPNHGFAVLTGPVICMECKNDMERQFGTVPDWPAFHLEMLLKQRPADSPQATLARLMMVQCKMLDDKDETGCEQDVEHAKKELLALADDVGFGPAQHVLASYYMRDIEENLFFGPLHFLPPPQEIDIPFEINHSKAKQYLRKSVESENPMALNEVGVMYKNGHLFDTNKPLAFEIFCKAGNAGDPRAMCNAAQMLLRGDGMEEDPLQAAKWYRRAVMERDWQSAKMMLVQMRQIGVVDREECNQYMRELSEGGFFETPQGQYFMDQMRWDRT